MGRSVDHLLTDCYLGQLSPYLNISTLETFPGRTDSKVKPLLEKKEKKEKIRKLMKRKTPDRISKTTDKYKPQRIKYE